MLTGEPRMKERPIGHLVDALRRAALRSTIWSRKIIHRRLRGGFQGGNVEVDGSVSSQFPTAADDRAAGAAGYRHRH